MDTIVRWLTSARDWLDERGKPAWIAAMIFAFILFWPIGLAILFYMIGSKRMKRNGNHGCGWKKRHGAYRSTGNTAFDNYREETLKRLEDERDSFVSFLEELRAAKDRAEFDQFMAKRDTSEAPA